MRTTEAIRGGISVSPEYNGPVTSGNGGYSCGLFASLVPGPAVVELRSPVPLGTGLSVAEDLRGGILRVLHGEVLVASVEPAAALELEAPVAPTLEQARAAARGYRAPSGGVFSSCFVCGPDRADAFGVFAGAVEGGPAVASPWIPRSDAADGSGSVREEMIWAVLDCPTYFALYVDDDAGMPPAFLARMQAEIHGSLQVGEAYVVAAWPIGRDGRKLRAGSAVFDADGAVLASAQVLLIEARPAPPADGEQS